MKNTHPPSTQILLRVILILTFVLALPAPSWALERVPGANDIFKTLHPGHPRLLGTAEDFAALKKRIATDPLVAQWYARLIRQAQAIAQGKPLTMGVTQGDRVVLTGTGELRNHLYTLGMLYQLDRDPQYVELAWRDMQSALELKDWNPRHFLGVAETSRALAIGYDWLYDGLSPEQRHAIEQALGDKALKIAQAAYHGRYIYGWWIAVHDNWNQVCNGAMGMAALAIADVSPKLAGDVLTNAIRFLPAAMNCYAPDGAWPEGVAYWGYGGEYNVQFLAALDSALGTDFGLAGMPGFALTGEFPIQMTGPTGEAFNFSDAPIHTRSASPMMLWLARRFDRPQFAQTYLPYARGGVEDMLWYDAAIATAKPQKTLPTDFRFRGPDVFSFRSSWSDPHATWIAFKAGDNTANHAHLDLGSFVLEALGHRWAVDLGSDHYNLPDYFHSKRWTYYRTRTESHNTLLIDPSDAPGQHLKAAAKVTNYHVNPNGSGATATIDLTKAYLGQRHAPKSITRTITRQKNRIVLEDDIRPSSTGTQILWLFHTPAQVQLLDDGAMLAIKDAKLKLHIVEPAGAKFVVRDAAPLSTSPNPPGQSINKGISQLSLTIETDKQLAPVKIIVEMIPQTP